MKIGIVIYIWCRTVRWVTKGTRENGETLWCMSRRIMKVNARKSKTLVLENDGIPLWNISLNGEKMEAVDGFRYFRAKFSEDGNRKAWTRRGILKGRICPSSGYVQYQFCQTWHNIILIGIYINILFFLLNW